MLDYRFAAQTWNINNIKSARLEVWALGKQALTSVRNCNLIILHHSTKPGGKQVKSISHKTVKTEGALSWRNRGIYRRTNSVRCITTQNTQISLPTVNITVYTSLLSWLNTWTWIALDRRAGWPDQRLLVQPGYSSSPQYKTQTPSDPTIKSIREVLPLGRQRTQREAGHSPPSNVERKNAWWIFTTTSHTSPRFCL